MNYDDIAALSGTAGLIFFIVLFVAVLVYALWLKCRINQCTL